MTNTDEKTRIQEALTAKVSPLALLIGTGKIKYFAKKPKRKAKARRIAQTRVAPPQPSLKAKKRKVMKALTPLERHLPGYLEVKRGAEIAKILAARKDDGP